MRYNGRIVKWDDARGFGFIEPAGGGRQLFFHISDYRSAGRPAHGETVQFAIGRGRDGEPAARLVSALASEPLKQDTPIGAYMRDAVRVWLAALILALAFLAAIVDRMPIEMVGLYGVMGILTYGIYALDKRAAQTEARRVPELRLHGLDLAFGLLGGLLAQQLLRHKTSKPEFALISFAIAALHGLVLFSVALGLLPLDELTALIR